MKRWGTSSISVHSAVSLSWFVHWVAGVCVTLVNCVMITPVIISAVCSEWQRSVSVSLLWSSATQETHVYNTELQWRTFTLYIANFLKKYFLMLSWLLIVARALLVFNLIFNFHFNSSFSHFLTGYCHFIWWVILNVSILEFYFSYFSISTLTYNFSFQLLIVFYIYNLNSGNVGTFYKF